MTLIITKYAITAFIIVLVSEVAKHAGKAGALISSLPFVTILVMIWLFIEKQPTEKIAVHAYYTFWYVIPTLPMFLALPAMLRKGLNFWAALGLSVVITFICFVLTAIIGKKFGIDLIP